MKNLCFYDFPVGKIGIATEYNKITAVFFDHRNNLSGYDIGETPIIKLAAKQLEEYFRGERKTFDLPLSLEGTKFQQSVWQALRTIPYGETRSYKEIATQIGNPKASRAVGHSNNKNPIAIIIPCHRVIGQNGKITGYAGGLEAKRFLLELESQQYFDYGKKEIDYLKAQDPVLGQAINQIGQIKRPIIPDLFKALLNTIVGQQISTKAQATIWRRMQDRFSPLTPAHIARISTEKLQTCGISMRKAGYIKEIAETILNGHLDLDSLPSLSDAEICQLLTKLKGIGIWTAEMLMIFSMQRKNIISWDDLAIQRGLRMLYGHDKITPQLFAKYKQSYSPYATIASLYLWEIASGKYELELS